MSKSTRNLIIVVVVAVVLAGAVFGAKALIDYIEAVRTPETTDVEDTSKVLINITNYNFIDGLIIDNSYGVVEFSNTDNGWELISEDIDAESGLIEVYVMLASYIKGAKLIEENVSDKSVYGLNNPIRVTLKLRGGEETFLLGGLTKTGETFYVMKEGETAVYTLDGNSTFNLAPLDLGTYFAMNVISIVVNKDFFPETDYNYLHFERNNQVVIETSKNEDLTWTMTAPIKIETEATSLSVIFVSMQDCQIVQYLGTDNSQEKLEEYGLVNPRYVIKYTCDSGKERTIYFGNDSSSSAFIYAMDVDSGLVVTLSKSDLEFLDNKAVDLVAYVIYTEKVVDHAYVTSTWKGGSSVLDLPVGDETDSFINNIPVNSDTVSEYYTAMLSALQPSDIDADAKPEGEKALTIVFEKKDGTKREFSFIAKVNPEDNKVYEYYLFDNGEYTGILVSARDVEGAMR